LVSRNGIFIHNYDHNYNHYHNNHYINYDYYINYYNNDYFCYASDECNKNHRPKLHCSGSWS
jgi:hypothetical protein